MTQYLLFYLVIQPGFEKGGVNPLLDNFLFFLLVIDTILIAAAGNVVNDLFDESTDAINEKTKVGYHRSKAMSWLLVLILNTVFISLYVAYQIDNLKLSLISVAAIGLLILYSAYLQRTTLVGNFVVSLFVAFVTGIIWFAERAAYRDLAKIDEVEFKQLTLLLSCYMIFSFVANMYREIVKDIEDVPGDARANYNTIAVSWGVARAKIVAIFYGVFLFLLELGWVLGNPLSTSLTAQVVFVFLIMAPTAYAIYQTNNSRTVQDFHKNSTLIKIIMAGGLIYLVILKLI